VYYISKTQTNTKTQTTTKMRKKKTIVHFSGSFSSFYANNRKHKNKTNLVVVIIERGKRNYKQNIKLSSSQSQILTKTAPPPQATTTI